MEGDDYDAYMQWVEATPLTPKDWKEIDERIKKGSCDAKGSSGKLYAVVIGGVKLMVKVTSLPDENKAIFTLMNMLTPKTFASPHLLLPLDFGVSEDGDKFAIVMTHIPHENIPSPHGWSEMHSPDLAAMMLKLSNFVKMFNKEGAAHRDIKPGNMFLCEGILKLFDFDTSNISEKAAGTIEFFTKASARAHMYGNEMTPEDIAAQDAYAFFKTFIWFIIQCGRSKKEESLRMWPEDGHRMTVANKIANGHTDELFYRDKGLPDTWETCIYIMEVCQRKDIDNLAGAGTLMEIVRMIIAAAADIASSKTVNIDDLLKLTRECDIFRGGSYYRDRLLNDLKAAQGLLASFKVYNWLMKWMDVPMRFMTFSEIRLYTLIKEIRDDVLKNIDPETLRKVKAKTMDSLNEVIGGFFKKRLHYLKKAKLLLIQRHKALLSRRRR
jgi:serine/threonine protein kinase